MRFPLFLSPITLLLVLQGASSIAFAQSKPPTSEVTGRVTVSGRGAAGVALALRMRAVGPQQQPSIKTATDAEGYYRLKEVPPGQYEVMVLAPVFVPKEEGGRPYRSILVVEGETIENIDFELVRGAVVTGKVTNADGRPLIEERVSLIPATAGRDVRMSLVAKVGITDDRGVYRIFGIRPGRYRAFAGRSEMSPIEAQRARSVYQQTFHPNVTDPESAKIIDLSEGAEVTSVDITLGSAIQTFAVAGRVTDETGQPVANVSVGLRNADPRAAPSFYGQSAVSNANGEFRLLNILPGKYATLMLPRGDTESWAESVPVEVVDQDVSGLLVKLHKGASITGTLSLENPDDRIARSKLHQIQIGVFVQDSQVNTGSRRMIINPDSSFRVAGLQPGNVALYIDSRNVPANKGFSLVRVEKEGVPQPSGLTIKAGDQIGGVRVVLAYGSSVINGTVRVENGPLPSGGRLFVRIHRLGDKTPMQLFPGEVDSRGRFRIENVPLGTYDIYAYAVLPNSRGSSPKGQQQLLVSGGSAEVTIVVDLKQPEPPSN